MTNPVLFLAPWHPSPTILAVMIVFGGLFWRGSRRIRISRRRQLAFWAGLFVLYLATHTGLDYFAERQFFMHRIQQTIVRDIGPLLIVLAQPVAVLWSGFPKRWRKSFHPSAIMPVVARRLWNFLTHPFLVGMLFVGLSWFWLIPAVHFITMLDLQLYRVMNWTMVAIGLLFWSLVLDARPSPPARLKPGFRILLVMAIMPLDMVPGIILTFADSNVYPLYDLCGRAFVNITAHEDQALGGLIIWVAGNTINLLGALAALYLGFYKAADAEMRQVT